MNGETTVKCEETIYEIKMFSAVDEKQSKRVVTVQWQSVPVSRERMLQQETIAVMKKRLTTKSRDNKSDFTSGHASKP